MLTERRYDEIWQKYCGFLELDVKQFMEIQNRLLMEQIELMSKCNLGRNLMKGIKPMTVDEFREFVPLTTYEDYADTLLAKSEHDLPAKPAFWIETTWEGGTHPIKLAPYTESMIAEFTNTFIACILLATSNKKGSFSLSRNDRFLCGTAPLPYLTGLIPYGLKKELDLQFLPPLKEAESMSFSERNKRGFKLGMRQGIDFFVGVSSVLVKISESFVNASGSTNQAKEFFKSTPEMAWRLIKAWYKRKIKKQPVLPKDLWKVKGLICGGTDSAVFKDRIEYFWGVRPLEVYSGTEFTAAGTETWAKNGLTFLPDVNFLEFIPEQESIKSMDNPLYTPKTVLLDELVPGERYEFVPTNFKGGVFMRYRVGDIIECLSLSDRDNDIKIPQFRYIDRITKIIDIAGFTRITADTIIESIKRSGLKVTEWVACKELDEEENQPKIHIYLEMEGTGLSKKNIHDHISANLKEVDPDYKALGALLGMDPLRLTLLHPGTFSEYKRLRDKPLQRMNPHRYVVGSIIEIDKRLRGVGL